MDFSVSNNFTIYLVTPNTTQAQEWWDENVGGDSSFGSAYAVEHRYIYDIVDGILNDGLTVEIDGTELKAA